jgi:RHS repeat-associated protein
MELYDYMVVTVSDDATDLGSSGFGLMFYNARWYDPYLNHMTQPDTIVPDPYNSQDYDRYSYARNNPIRYNDPSGHIACESFDDDGNCVEDLFWNWHNNNRLQVSAEGLDFLKNQEGSVTDGDSHTLYDDPAGNCTIGYGHLVHLGKCDGTDPSETEFLKGIDEDVATKLLKHDLEVAADAVRHDTEVPITQEEFDALVSFAYNVGSGAFSGSTMLEELNKGRYDTRKYLNEWVYACDDAGTCAKLPGLVTRRYEEGIIFWYWFYP